MPIRTTSAADLQARLPKPVESARPPDLRAPKPAVAVMTFTLPFPPSYNRYWRTSSRGNHISKEGLAFKAAAAAVLGRVATEPVEGPVTVSLNYYFARRNGDLDNRIKQVLDALQGHAYVNDSQIVRLQAERFFDKDNPRVEVEVTETPHPSAASGAGKE